VLGARFGRFPGEPRRVTPKIFETIEGAFFAVKNVHHHLQVIEHDPLARGKTIHRRRADVMVVLQTRFDFSSDCFQLRLGSGRTNHKKIGEGGNFA
jgi:hypothetical protein